MAGANTTVRVHLTFPEQLIKQPIVSQLVREIGVTVNIRRANVDENVGWMICEFRGDHELVERSIVWLGEIGVEVNRLADVVES